MLLSSNSKNMSKLHTFSAWSMLAQSNACACNVPIISQQKINLDVIGVS